MVGAFLLLVKLIFFKWIKFVFGHFERFAGSVRSNGSHKVRTEWRVQVESLSVESRNTQRMSPNKPSE